MCRPSCVLCCCMLLFVASSSDSWKNLENDDEQSRDSTVRHDFHAKDQSDKDESIRYNPRENFIMNYDEAQNEFRDNSTKDNHDNDDSTHYNFRAHTTKNDEESNQTKSGFIKTRFMKADDENNFASQQTYGNDTKTDGKNNYTMDSNNNDTFPPETCKNNKCIQLCCPRGDRLIREKCVAGKGNYSFPDVYGHTSNDSSQSEDKSLDKVFQLIVRDPCQEIKRHILINPDEYIGIFPNSSLYVPIYDVFVPWAYYCLAVVNRDVYDVIACTSIYPMVISMGLVVSLPFLAATFVVYSILPEFKNIHGYTLRAHVVSLFVSYAIFPIFHQMNLLEMGYSVCILLAYLLTFSFTASFLWLNVICFDIWWAFREIRLSQGIIKQETKFMLYSIYAWGSPLLLNIICAIMDYVPDLPEYLIRPKYCRGGLWFGNAKAKSLYFYLPVGITIICNICLYVITAFKIICHKKRTADDLRNSNSRRHDDNKQRYMMYLKLLIVMGITWIMEIISWFYSGNLPNIIWYPTDMINALQGFVIFVIFVCTKKIKRLLFKRLGWQDCNLLGCNLAGNDGQSTITTSSKAVSLEEMSPRMQATLTPETLGG